MPRFEIRDGSQSAHCCFHFTVVDTTQPFLLPSGEQYVGSTGPQYVSVCECFNLADAKFIASALNAQAKGD